MAVPLTLTLTLTSTCLVNSDGSLYRNHGRHSLGGAIATAVWRVVRPASTIVHRVPRRAVGSRRDSGAVREAWPGHNPAQGRPTWRPNLWRGSIRARRRDGRPRQRPRKGARAPTCENHPSWGVPRLLNSVGYCSTAARSRRTYGSSGSYCNLTARELK